MQSQRAVSLTGSHPQTQMKHSSRRNHRQLATTPGPIGNIAVELIIQILDMVIAWDGPWAPSDSPFKLLLVSKAFHQYLFPVLWKSIHFSSSLKVEKFLQTFVRNDQRQLLMLSVKHIKVVLYRYDMNILPPLLTLLQGVRILETSGINRFLLVKAQPTHFTMGQKLEVISLDLNHTLLQWVTHLHVYTNRFWLPAFQSPAMSLITHLRIELVLPL
ncbi:hypothetical protein K439DRAFT_1616739 [Ramaria rubella]|nr:hypothetical protein K439DRAFT_1616739 [Ramaria rubella]